VNLADVIGRWVGRVEIVLAGADDDMRAGEQALAAGDGLGARAAARRVLERAPDSPVGLALLADACDAAHLEAELALTLEELARRAPSRAEVWVRLARARQATGSSTDEIREALLRALAVAEGGSTARVDALLALADVDLADHQGARAELWLARIAGDGADVAVRRAEARLLRGDPSSAKALLEPIAWAPVDARAALALGRARAELGETEAFAPLLRAFVLDQAGASEALSGALARLPSDAQTRTRVRSIVDAKGEQSLARWHAAFAEAEGDRGAARVALRAALGAAEPGAAKALLEASIEDHDAEGLGEALQSLGADDDPLVIDGRAIAAAVSLGATRTTDVLDAAAKVLHPRAIPWAEALVRAVAARWIPASGDSGDWTAVLTRLGDHAHALGDARRAAAIGAISASRSSPVVLAVVGEFNAGKSTFINALVGEAVAPTGILPTTAVLHHLRWAPDSLAVAKILLAAPSQPSERIVAPADLRATLERIDPRTVERVEIRMPLASLARVEVLDTPGFNADVAGHEAVAWSALDEADVAVWLVDATQAVKQSERRVLEQAARRRLPVQVLVNKADRLTHDDVGRVLASVSEGLAAMGVSSWRPPLAFSSKRALAGRLGDAEALRDSGWEGVHLLMDEGIVGQSDRLKELSLRRRAGSVVADLAAGYRARVADEETAALARAEHARQGARAATRLEQEIEEIVAHLTTSVDGPVQRWARDLSMVFVGKDTRDRAIAAADPMLERYRVDSAVSAVAPILCRELQLLVPAALRPTVEVGAFPTVVRAIVRAAAAATSVAAHDDERFALAVCRASVTALVEHLLAYAAATGEPAATTTKGALRELEAFAAALE
jgi:GTP-binding protein EngB required for normal cell division